MFRPNRRLLALIGAATLAFTAPAWAAATNLVVNGDFEQTSSSTPSELGLNGYTVTGWTNNNGGYNFIFNPTLAGSAGSTSASQYAGSNGASVSLYTPTASTATTTAGSLISPTGGNVLGADGAFQVGAVSQTVTGLAVGTNYLLTFWWAAGQQTGYTGTTTENWGVTFGNQSYTTPTVTTPSQGFFPWQQAAVVFSATATSQLLSFLAAGTPAGQPPFSLLDGVSLVAAPEPATWAVMMVGLVAISTFTARRRRPQPAVRT